MDYIQEVADITAEMAGAKWSCEEVLDCLESCKATVAQLLALHRDSTEDDEEAQPLDAKQTKAIAALMTVWLALVQACGAHKLAAAAPPVLQQVMPLFPDPRWRRIVYRASLNRTATSATKVGTGHGARGASADGKQCPFDAAQTWYTVLDATVGMAEKLDLFFPPDWIGGMLAGIVFELGRPDEGTEEGEGGASGDAHRSRIATVYRLVGLISRIPSAATPTYPPAEERKRNSGAAAIAAPVSLSRWCLATSLLTRDVKQAVDDALHYLVLPSTHGSITGVGSADARRPYVNESYSNGAAGAAEGEAGPMYRDTIGGVAAPSREARMAWLRAGGYAQLTAVFQGATRAAAALVGVLPAVIDMDPHASATTESLLRAHELLRGQALLLAEFLEDVASTPDLVACFRGEPLAAEDSVPDTADALSPAARAAQDAATVTLRYLLVSPLLSHAARCLAMLLTAGVPLEASQTIVPLGLLPHLTWAHALVVPFEVAEAVAASGPGPEVAAALGSLAAEDRVDPWLYWMPVLLRAVKKPAAKYLYASGGGGAGGATSSEDEDEDEDEALSGDLSSLSDSDEGDSKREPPRHRGKGSKTTAPPASSSRHYLAISKVIPPLDTLRSRALGLLCDGTTIKLLTASGTPIGAVERACVALQAAGLLYERLLRQAPSPSPAGAPQTAAGSSGGSASGRPPRHAPAATVAKKATRRPAGEDADDDSDGEDDDAGKGGAKRPAALAAPRQALPAASSSSSASGPLPGGIATAEEWVQSIAAVAAGGGALLAHVLQCVPENDKLVVASADDPTFGPVASAGTSELADLLADTGEMLLSLTLAMTEHVKWTGASAPLSDTARREAWAAITARVPLLSGSVTASARSALARTRLGVAVTDWAAALRRLMHV